MTGPASKDAVEVELTTRPLSAEGFALRSDGALVVFSGVVRDNADGRPVINLEYEAYEQMAVARMTEIASEAVGRWQLGSVSIRHRTGRLEVGEISVVVAVSAPHRSHAFQAAAYCIDSIKKSVPIWKKENFADGSSRWPQPG